MHLNQKDGWIEVITGPMFAGKTEELLRRVKRLEYAKKNIVVFKPLMDNRYADNEVVSHNKNKTKSVNITKAFEIFDYIDKDTDVVAIDEIQFLFSANKGGNFNELKKAASGGELSRIMIAIKSVLSKYIQLPTIMFDEIDTGVSGEISNKMGDIMLEMSKTMQVFSITHLPQIAAKGHSHFKVFKEDVNDVTQTNLVKLNHDERIVEIAQMLGGLEMSSSAIAHAKELLN